MNAPQSLTNRIAPSSLTLPAPSLSSHALISKPSSKRSTGPVTDASSGDDTDSGNAQLRRSSTFKPSVAAKLDNVAELHRSGRGESAADENLPPRSIEQHAANSDTAASLSSLTTPLSSYYC